MSWQHFDRSCKTFLTTGRMMLEGGLAQLRDFDAIYLGAFGHPNVPDHFSLWGLLIPIRREFRQYVNVRPVRSLPGLEAPPKNVLPEQIDSCVVRENNEGEYSDVGGWLYRDSEEEIAVQQSVFTRRVPVFAAVWAKADHFRYP
jgi:tartrate dehydrogenase/decarboxylase/D-malate dehydrogenase